MEEQQQSFSSSLVSPSIEQVYWRQEVQTAEESLVEEVLVEEVDRKAFDIHPTSAVDRAMEE